MSSHFSCYASCTAVLLLGCSLRVLHKHTRTVYRHTHTLILYIDTIQTHAHELVLIVSNCCVPPFFTNIICLRALMKYLSYILCPHKYTHSHTYNRTNRCCFPCCETKNENNKVRRRGITWTSYHLLHLLHPHVSVQYINVSMLVRPLAWTC